MAATKSSPPVTELYIQRATQADAMQALSKLQICFQANPKDLTTLDLLSRAFVVLGQAKKGIEVQKEMARIARDQQRYDVYFQLVEKLLISAPNDEAVQELANLLFAHTGVERIIAITDARNGASIRLLERLGMRLQTTASAIFRGEPCQEHLYVLDRAGCPTL